MCERALDKTSQNPTKRSSSSKVITSKITSINYTPSTFSVRSTTPNRKTLMKLLHFNLSTAAPRSHHILLIIVICGASTAQSQMESTEMFIVAYSATFFPPTKCGRRETRKKLNKKNENSESFKMKNVKLEKPTHIVFPLHFSPPHCCSST